MTYTAQELNRKIVLEKLTVTQDPVTGEQVESWGTFATVFAKVEPLVGREFFAAAAVQAEHTVKFTMRYLSGIDTTMRIVFDGRTFDIHAVQNVKHLNRETLVYARAL